MCGVRFPLPLLVAVMLGCSWSQVLAANAWDPGENGPEKVNRLDSGLDTPVKVSLYNPHASPTKLFASCIVSASAYVRFHKLSFPAHNVVFTRYVPIAAQLELYSTSWRVVNKSSLNTSLACAYYAEQNPSAMMYQFNGTQCRVSTARMPMKKETCGNKNATAVFIKTSCPEPTAQVTLTPAPGTINISWTTYDPCHLAVKFKIDWVNVGGSNVTMVNGDVFHHRINDRLGCKIPTVTVTALDSFSQPYGNPTAISNLTLPRGPPKMANLTTVIYVDHLDVTWSIADDECLRINEFVLEWKNGTSYSGSETLSNSTYNYSITGLHACTTFTVSVKARYDAGAGTTNVVSNSAETLPQDPAFQGTSADPKYTQADFQWTLTNDCKKATWVKIEVNGRSPVFQNVTNQRYTASPFPCNTSVSIIVTPVVNAMSATPVGENVTISTVTGTTDPAFQMTSADPKYTRADFQWTLTDVCNKATKVKIEVNGGSPVFQALTNQRYTASPFPCDTSVSIIVTPVVDATSATPVGENVTISTVTGTTDASFMSFGPWRWSSGTNPDLPLSWAVDTDECNYITGYSIDYGAGQSLIVPDKTATGATIIGYNACDGTTVSINMLKGTVVMDTLQGKRPATKLMPGGVQLGFRKAVISWSVDGSCSYTIHHYKVTQWGSTVDTTDSTRSAMITNQDQCHTLTVSIDGVDSNGSSVAESTEISSSLRNKICNGNALAEDVCYGCLHYSTAVPKLNKAAAATKCTASRYKLYMPADAAEVADLIAFLGAKLVPAADYADVRLFVDLTYASSKWTWGGVAAVDETSSSNWASSHPDSSIGECAILSGEDGFKLKSVDCSSLQFSMCIEYVA